VKNPVKVARAVLETPHLLLIGDGATQFARSLGMPEYDPTTPARREATEKTKARLRRADPELPAFWRTSAWRERWNYTLSPHALGLDPADAGADTVGVAVRATDGRFGVALSTGGTGIVLRGPRRRRAHLSAPACSPARTAPPPPPAPASASSRRCSRTTVQGWLAAGAHAEEAATRAVALIPADAPTRHHRHHPHRAGRGGGPFHGLGGARGGRRLAGAGLARLRKHPRRPETAGKRD
jgi:hypothetical protein